MRATLNAMWRAGSSPEIGEEHPMSLFRRNGKHAGLASDNGAGTGTGQDFIIRAEGVVKCYNTGTQEVRALRGVDFAVARGEMVAVMGPSGCGKTTLLNCLSGLDEVTSGRAWLDGQDLATMSDRKRTDYRARRMGFIFQVYNLLPVLSAVENVELPLLVSGIRPREARDQSLAAWTRSASPSGPSTGRRSCRAGSGSG